MRQLRLDDLEKQHSRFDVFATSGWRVDTDTFIPWLRRKGLMADGASLRDDRFTTTRGATRDAIRRGAMLATRPKRRSAWELGKIKQERTKPGVYDPYREKIWAEYQDPVGTVEVLDLHRLPVDTIAFYHPFHLEPAEEWGIYIRVDELLEYARDLTALMLDHVRSFTPESLLAYSLFEIFHHEYFHHLEECAATTIEILSAGLGEPRRIYWDYRNHAYEAVLGRHRHKPLAEALANAYAYNSLSFYSRVRFSFRVVQVQVYQAALRRFWLSEPDGYCHAEHYTGSKYVPGAAQLLAMMLSNRTIEPESLLLLAKHVLVHGHSAFAHKADVPTYLVGTAAALEAFEKWVPAPVETYTDLFALRLEDTAALDAYLAERKRQEERARRG